LDSVQVYCQLIHDNLMRSDGNGRTRRSNPGLSKVRFNNGSIVGEVKNRRNTVYDRRVRQTCKRDVLLEYRIVLRLNGVLMATISRGTGKYN